MVSLASLFAKFGSGVEDDTEALLVIVPTVVVAMSTTTVTVAVPPDGKAPMAQGSVVQLPCDDETELTVTPAGSVSFTDTPDASDGPLLDTVKV